MAGEKERSVNMHRAGLELTRFALTAEFMRLTEG
jgi:hypothetical protein